MTIIHTLSVLFARAKNAFQTNGLTAVLSRGFAFLIFHYGTYYLYEHTIKEENEADFVPRIENFTFKIVSNHREADELAANGFGDFRQHFISARRSLDKGAIAFCVFIGRELAHIGWVAMTEEAKKSILDLLFQIALYSRLFNNVRTARM